MPAGPLARVARPVAKNPRLLAALPLLGVLCAPVAAQVALPAWLPSSPFPAWGQSAAGTVIQLAYQPSLGPLGNGAAFEQLAENLAPGTTLELGPGTWSVSNRFDLSIQGSANQPVRIVAADPNDRPVITRPSASQNCLNIGSNGRSRYLVLQNLEFTGGSDLIRIYDGSFTWIDGCYLHDGNGLGIAVQTISCSHLYLTRNEITRPGPGTPNEGIYLGGTSGSLVVTDSVIAFNHVHGTRSASAGQGDGIEVKPGSTRNWIHNNRVHDCQNPCILVYGTGGVDENVVSANLCYDSDDAVLQVQGDALVLNNIALGGSAAFQSHDHQGTSQRLQLVHNTFVSVGRAATLARWGNRPGMVLCNNVLYSLTDYAVWFGIGDQGVVASGNVIFGASNPVHTADAYQFGQGLGDLENVDLVTFAADARPRAGHAIDNRGDPAFALPFDQLGTPRPLPVDPGALANATTLTSDIASVPVTSGGRQQLTFRLGPDSAGASYAFGLATATTTHGITAAGITLPVTVDPLFLLTVTGGLPGTMRQGAGILDGSGTGRCTIAVPPLPPGFAGITLHPVAIALRQGIVTHVSNAVDLRLQ